MDDRNGISRHTLGNIKTITREYECVGFQLEKFRTDGNFSVRQQKECMPIAYGQSLFCAFCCVCMHVICSLYWRKAYGVKLFDIWTNDEYIHFVTPILLLSMNNIS